MKKIWKAWYHEGEWYATAIDENGEWLMLSVHLNSPDTAKWIMELLNDIAVLEGKPENVMDEFLADTNKYE